MHSCTKERILLSMCKFREEIVGLLFPLYRTCCLTTSLGDRQTVPPAHPNMIRPAASKIYVKDSFRFRTVPCVSVPLALEFVLSGAMML